MQPSHKYAICAKRALQLVAESQNQKHMRTKWQVVVFVSINGEQENCQTSSLLKYYLEVLGKNLQKDLHLPFFISTCVRITEMMEANAR